VLLSVYAIATRMGVLVARSALLVPSFVLHLDDADAAVSAAARAVFDRHRDAIMKALAGHHRARGSTPETPFTYDEAVEAARNREIAMRRRLALYCLAGWAAVTIGIIVVLVATGAGPTG
jgi:hypothetical protein